MIIDREVSTDLMLIIIVTFDQGNQYRMRRNFQRLLDPINFIGLATVLDLLFEYQQKVRFVGTTGMKKLLI